MALNPQNPRGLYRKYTEDDRQMVIERAVQRTLPGRAPRLRPASEALARKPSSSEEVYLHTV